MIINKFWVAATAACLMTVGAIAQAPANGSSAVTPGQASTEGSHASLSSGAKLQAELTKSIDAKKAKPGDEITARLTQDLNTGSDLAIPRGSRLIGRVTEAQAKTKENPESRLGVVFEKVVLKSGQEITFNGVLQALAAPVQNAVAAPMDQSSGMGGGGAMGGGRSGGTMAPMSNGTRQASPGGGATSGPASTPVGSANNSSAGGPANGGFNANSRGVIGMDGVALNNAAAGNVQTSVISDANHNLKLDSGTQMIVQVTGPKSPR